MNVEMGEARYRALTHGSSGSSGSGVGVEMGEARYRALTHLVR